MSWRHFNPVTVYFGQGCRASLAQLLRTKRALVVCSPRGREQILSDGLLGDAVRSNESVLWLDSVGENPSLNQLESWIDQLRVVAIDCVVSFGGGSVVDSAKACSLALSPVFMNRSLAELLKSAPNILADLVIPHYAVPTTAGTGSEVTPFATVWDRDAKRKLSLSGPAVYPRAAFVDPELSASVPYDVTLNTGLDAINQAAESIWNRNMTPITEMLAHRALQLGMRALPRLLNNLEDLKLRGSMAEASLLAGLAISQTRTATCHAISYPLTAHFGVPHGLACGFTMPSVLRYNMNVDDGRFIRLAKVLLPEVMDSSSALLDEFYRFNQSLEVGRRVRQIVGSLDALIGLREEMYSPGRAENALNPVSPEKMTQLLYDAWFPNASKLVGGTLDESRAHRPHNS